MRRWVITLFMLFLVGLNVRWWVQSRSRRKPAETPSAQQQRTAYTCVGVENAEARRLSCIEFSGGLSCTDEKGEASIGCVREAP